MGLAVIHPNYYSTLLYLLSFVAYSIPNYYSTLLPLLLFVTKIAIKL